MNPDDTTDNTMPPVDDKQAAQDDQQQQPTEQNVPTVPPVVGTPVKAEDVDLIEKAWVEKAKEIVDGTHGDPFAQSKQLNQIKADYIKKRYNRDVKVDE